MQLTEIGCFGTVFVLIVQNVRCRILVVFSLYPHPNKIARDIFYKTATITFKIN